jgi:endonuclease/exonuclease/phosphatase family metal-dependent hydrolase
LNWGRVLYDVCEFEATPLPDSGYLTFPSASPDRAIDWIFASGALRIRHHRVIASDLSDHLMVVAEIEERVRRGISDRTK